MKKPLLLFLFLSVFCGQFLHGQNWEIYKSGDRFLYYMNGHGYDSTVVFIQADHDTVIGNDTTFYMHRKVVNPNAVYNNYLYGNFPFTFQRKITRYTNGSWQFSDTANWVLRPLDPLSSSWIFDSVHGINASITRVYSGLILGQNDSLKTISLSNGDSISLSKNHGLVALPSTMTGTTPYSLAGFNASADDSIPGFQQIFNFHPGDVFEYVSSGYSYTNYSNYRGGSVKRDSIISVQWDTTGVTYTIYRWEVDSSYSSYNGNSPRNATQGITTEHYFFNDYGFVDFDMNHTLDGYLPTYSFHYFLLLGNDYTFQCKTKNFTPGTSGASTDSLLFTQYASLNPTVTNQTFGSGFGLIDYYYTTRQNYPLSVSSNQTILVGAIKGNVLYGNMHDISFFLASPNTQHLPAFSVGPNPAESSISVTASDDRTNANVKVFDSMGRLVMEEYFTGSITLNLETLGNGMYMFQLTEGNTAKEVKVVHLTHRN